MEIVLVGADDCPDAGPTCLGEGDELPAGAGSVVVLDAGSSTDDVARLVETARVVVVVGDPDGARVVRVASAAPDAVIRVVPIDHELGLEPVDAALLVAADDTSATFEPTEVDAGVFVAVVRTVTHDQIAETTVATEPDVLAGSVPAPAIRWTVELPAPYGRLGLHHRAVVGDRVLALLGNDGVARGLDAATGEELWATPIVPSAAVAPATFADLTGDIVVMSMGQPDRRTEPDRALWALDLASGNVRWKVEIDSDGIVGHPVSDGDRVYVWLARNADDTALRALDLATGEELWKLPGEVSAAPPRVEGDIVWAGNTAGVMRAVDAATGEELLRFEQPPLGLFTFSSRPVIDGDRVLFGSDIGSFYALDRETADELWSFSPDDPTNPSGPVVVGDVVVFGSFVGNIYGLDVATGDVRWRTASGSGQVLSSPVAADGVVYVGSMSPEPAVHAIDGATGEPIWRLPVDEDVEASPVVDDDLVYVFTPGTVYAIER